MTLVLLSLGMLLLGSVAAMAYGSQPKLSSTLAACATSLAALFGAIPAAIVLAGGESLALNISWSLPYSSFALALDPLAAFFLIPVFVVTPAAAIYGAGYLSHETGRNLGPAWLAFCLLVASMMTVVLAADGLLFLIAWELTVLSSFFLVMFDAQKKENLRAGWIYLTASHLGTAFLLVLFLLALRDGGSLNFHVLAQSDIVRQGLGSGIFILAIIGFGTKAGFIPLHVWLPEAHPAAPSHVSAVMSGVMIKTGIYGIVRLFFVSGSCPEWCGWALLLIGLGSGVLGVLFALAQHDLKRLLAYHSVENIGIIALGLGLGLLAVNTGNRGVAVLALAGGLLHVLNHAVFKGLLFLGAGAVLQAAGTRQIDRLGGLLKRMPWTGNTFLIGCMSISGLPPFNGFVSEFLIYAAALTALAQNDGQLAGAAIISVAGLALIGGLAAACFAKAFSAAFLGVPREQSSADAREVGALMRFPMAWLAALCPLIAVSSPAALVIFARVLAVHPLLNDVAANVGGLQPVFLPLSYIASSGVLLCTLTLLILRVRARLLSTRVVRSAVTWDCGYAAPSTRMQYSASSFAQPLLQLFFPVHRTETHLKGVEGYFPTNANFVSHTSDLFQDAGFSPLFSAARRLLKLVTPLQAGVVQAYVLYIALTLAVLLVWGLT